MQFHLKNWNSRRRKHFQNSKIEKKTLSLCKAQNFASFDTSTIPVAHKLWEFGPSEVVKLKLFGRAIFLQTFLKYWWIVVPFKPPKPPSHTQHSYKIPQQHPLQVDTSLQAKIFVWKFDHFLPVRSP